ncbi:5'/3'-nucleotidase SurE [Candidatus Desantisbacteria bacterium CG1_02_38_46]|uniref:5'-nucleotidase SurE n=3 Tax=unclassified Candidatus Desantisiibacteriota TaxID=3106372 RepID=A0A2H9PB97_9BACT|nr:MAG: 5'/3'-nucleotidase SurE [Candidatus Desantisbacteria bacterium CG1_02_38_46]PIU51655.1 MAG: 5'/3'-nucleotidase SurE [Candidatus Desantisbacteria bacterium CG07_land_8_20_14_0_80_39_15]PIZ15967.1 MAG: 5'/3'-nucleotidase SurE [Candidatus Desantisbacteria bacterium CG_4_10_14_0_8_um_filter_39_17]
MAKILVTNDDGVHSPGLEVLRKHLKKLGDVIVVVPEREMSTASHSLTLRSPLRVSRIKKGIFITSGTPSDCINIGTLGILKEKPVLVVSGINRGPNLGDDITYSGTVAASIESTLRGIPSFAISVASFKNCRFNLAAKFAFILARYILKNGLPSHTFLNVNVPNVSIRSIQGVEITHQGKRIYKENLVKRTDPRGRTYYWLGGDEPTGEIEEGTDFAAVARKKISITPVQLDLTDYKMIDKLRNWHIKFP